MVHIDSYNTIAIVHLYVEIATLRYAGVSLVAVDDGVDRSFSDT